MPSFGFVIGRRVLTLFHPQVVPLLPDVVACALSPQPQKSSIFFLFFFLNRHH